MRGNLFSHALKLTNSHDRAEDLVQDTMLKLWDIRSEINLTDNPMSLAITILHNRHNDICRHEQYNTTTNEIDITTFQDEIEWHDEARLIKQIVQSLPPLQKQLFTMKEIEGYTSEEIMNITGCTAENLRRNLSRARNKIKETYLHIVNNNRKP